MSGSPKYLAVGHVTVDVLADGREQPGGSAFYAALQAARLGLPTRILTRGEPRRIERLLEAHAHELELEVQPARSTTTLLTSGEGTSRRQLLRAWAGEIELPPRIRVPLVHLAPVARELPASAPSLGGFVGLTPQGLARAWPLGGGEVRRSSADRWRSLGAAASAIVLSAHEREACARVTADGRASGALVVVTDGPRDVELQEPGGEPSRLAVPPVEPPYEDLGAGDVFAAALFVSLAQGALPADATAFANAAAAERLGGTIARREAIARRVEQTR